MSNPTPWKQAEDSFSIFIEDANGRIIADVRPCNMSMEDHRARAKVLAAAPEMFDELAAIDAELERGGKVTIEYGSVWHSKIRAAVQKAEAQ